MPATIVLSVAHDNPATFESLYSPSVLNAIDLVIRLEEEVENLSKDLGKICEEIKGNNANIMANMKEFMTLMEVMIVNTMLLKQECAGISSLDSDE